MRQRLAQLAGVGYAHERWLDASELRERIPALAPYVRGALGVDTDGAANPFRTTFAFRRKAEALGATVREGLAAREVRRDGGAWRVAAGNESFVAPVLVNCAGAWADRIAAAVGGRSR
jgi:sarcosine oxidase subunit beta